MALTKLSLSVLALAGSVLSADMEPIEMKVSVNCCCHGSCPVG